MQFIQELSIIIFSKQKPKQDYLLNVAVTNDLKSLVNKNIHKTQINFSKFYHNGDYAHEFLIAKSQIDYNIKDKMKSKGKPLSKFSAIHTGEVVQFRNKHQLTNISKEGSYPLIKIENVNSFKVSKKYDSWFKPKKGMQYTHSGGLILVKRLTSKEQPKRIIASFFEEKRFAVDNKLNLLKPYDSKYLISIMGLLNSKLIDYYFRLYSSNTQVSANELRSIPIIVDENIQKIVEDIQEGKKSLEELDNHVFNIYDLSKEEVNHVLDFYK